MLLLLLACTDPSGGDVADATADSAGDSGSSDSGSSDSGSSDSGGDSGSDSGGDSGSDSGGDSGADSGVHSSIPDGYAAPYPARIIFMGDSITAGSGATRNGDPYVELLQDNNPDHWPDSEALDLPAMWGQALPEVIDVSRGGATSNSFRYQQLVQVQDQLAGPVSGPTVVITTIVGNDVQALIATPDRVDEAIADIEDNLATAYDYFFDPETFPDGVWFYLANVYEPSDGVGQADECFFGLDLAYALDALDQVNAAVRAQAEERGVAWLDMNGHFKGHGYHASDTSNPYYHPDDPTLWFADDCIHPNDRGHHEIRRLFWYAAAGLPFPGDDPDTVE